MRIIRNLIILAVLGGVGFIVLQGIGGDSPADAQQSVVQDAAEVIIGDLTVSVNAVGTITPARRVLLAFELSALVSEVLVVDGQPVRAGEPLARLDLADLEMSVRNARTAYDLQRLAYEALTAPAREVDIAAAEAALNTARAAVNAVFINDTNNNQAEIARLQAELARNRLWQQQLQRDQRVTPVELPPGVPRSSVPVPSQEEINRLSSSLEQSTYEVQIADANFNSAVTAPLDRGSLAAANAQLVSAQVQLDRLLNGPNDIDLQLAQIDLERARLSLELAEANLRRAELVAPFDGVIAQSNLVVGELPPADRPAFILIDSSGYYINLAVDETDIGAIAVGQPVRLRVDALPEAALTGVVTRVAQTPTRIGQVVTYTTRVMLDPTLEPVRPDMNATATIVVQQLSDVLTLRNRFIRIDRATQQAFVTIERADGRFQEVPVTLGQRSDTVSQIVSGLEAGQRVVLLPRDSFLPFGGN